MTLSQYFSRLMIENVPKVRDAVGGDPRLIFRRGVGALSQLAWSRARRISICVGSWSR
jgi:hypothetical protein